MWNFNFSFLNTTQRKQEQQWWLSTQYLTANTFEIWCMFQRGGRVGRQINCFHPWLVLNKRRMTPEGRQSRDLCYCYWSVKPWQQLWIHMLHMLHTLSYSFWFSCIIHICPLTTWQLPLSDTDLWLHSVVTDSKRHSSCDGSCRADF